MERGPKIKHGVPASPEAVFGELKRHYWAAVQNEVQKMIEFHNVLKKADYQPHAPSSLESDNFKKMVNIWVSSQPNFDKDSTSNLYRETLGKAQEHLNEPEDSDHRYARFILQSSMYAPNSSVRRILRVYRGLQV
ncbi:hypothetical protein DL769_009903 [Monosporascus sp. CRB-8-3]|nr:hypothetical protein DL769_009903 [Monosporascus sp. CRB-8-3]